MYSYAYSCLVYSITAFVFLMSTPGSLIVPPKGGFLRAAADTAAMRSGVGGIADTDSEG